jgi:large subunit ribosomal protein L5
MSEQQNPPAPGEPKKGKAKPQGDGKPRAEGGPQAEGKAGKAPKQPGGGKPGKSGKQGKGGAEAKAAEVQEPVQREPIPPSRLQQKYREQVVPALMKEFRYTSPMQVPTLVKITVNMGVGEAIGNAKAMEAAIGDLTRIVGQKPLVTRAKTSIANFKLREGMQIGVMTTLRKRMMWHFLDRLISVALPQVRDFRGLPRRSFDGHGNYTLGIREQIIFPEISFDEIDKIRGMNISFTTTARTDEEAFRLLELIGIPFRKN